MKPSYDDLTITITDDRPASGMWHTGPNPCWVTVKHNPTGTMARCYHRSQFRARESAMACVELMLDAIDSTDKPEFIERIADK